MKKEFTCIVCPVGCRLSVVEENGEVTVSGNRCKRGQRHGLNEYGNPTRMLTTTIALSGAYIRRLPVISTQEISMQMMDECLKALYQMQATAPIAAGTVVAHNICGTGVDIVATRSIK